MNIMCRMLTAIIITLFLSACQADHKEERAQVVPQPKAKRVEESVAVEKNGVEVQKLQVIEVQKAQGSVDLKVPEKVLKQIDDKEQRYLLEPPPRIGETVNEKRKVKISGGVLFDTDKEKMVDKVDGGKVNISIPLN